MRGKIVNLVPTALAGNPFVPSLLRRYSYYNITTGATTQSQSLLRSWIRYKSIRPKKQPFYLSQNQCDRPQLQHHKTFFSKAKSMLKYIKEGNDRVDPQMILERQYIYLALLATQFRNLQRESSAPPSSSFLDGPYHHPTNTTHSDVGHTDLDYLNHLYEQAVDEIDAMKVDKLSNFQLRKLLQNAIQPQVREIFQAFDRVDQRLGIPLSSSPPNHNHNDQDSSPSSSTTNHHSHDGYGEISDPFVNVDWAPILSILTQELSTHERRRQKDEDRVSKQKTTLASSTTRSHHQLGSDTFWNRKETALQMILRFHQLGDLGRDTIPNDETDDVFGVNVATIDDSSLTLIRQYQTYNLARSCLLRQELGFSILMLQSLIPGAGRGVFLDGHALTGSLVAFQPGEIWPKEHLITNEPDVLEHFDSDQDFQISMRFDDYLVDSRESPVTVLIQEGSMNPWALGHMINHPPEHVHPNCQSTMLNFTERMKLRQLLRYVPNTYARKPGWLDRFLDLDETLMHGLCLLTTSDVSNEELLYDYRLQSSDTPDWYSIVTYGDDILDTDQIVLFRDDWKVKRDKKDGR